MVGNVLFLAYTPSCSPSEGICSTGSAANGRSSSGQAATTSEAARTVEPMREALTAIEGAVSQSRPLSQRVAPALSQVQSWLAV